MGDIILLFVPCQKYDFEVRVHIKNCEEYCGEECPTYLAHAESLGEYRGVTTRPLGKATVTEDLNPKRNYDTAQHLKSFTL